MKRFLSLILSIILLCSSMVGYCEESQIISIPSFLNLDMDALLSVFQEQPGFLDYSIDQNGTLILVIDKATQDELLEDLRAQLDDTISELLEGEGKVASFNRIEYNEDLTAIDVYLDQALFSGWDYLLSLNLVVGGYYYRLSSGVTYEEMTGAVNYIDESTGEIINSLPYKETMEEFTSGGEDEQSPLSTDAPPAPEPEETTDPAAHTALMINDIISLPAVCDFALESTSITERITSANGSFGYTAADGSKYVDICFYYKNTRPQRFTLDDEAFSGILLYMDTYEYDNAFLCYEYDNRSDFTRWDYSIDPLYTIYVHLVFVIPDEVAAAEGSLIATVSIHGDEYDIAIRD